MCGIVGYLGKEKDVREGLQFLRRLEYRGYDSAGGAWFSSKENKVFCLKAVGGIDALEEKINSSSLDLKGNPFIFHTRWATTGKVNEANTHPHFDCQKEIFLVHNGIIENYQLLKEKLEKEGHQFFSETDSEVLAHLIEKYFQGNLEEAVRLALREVRGTYGMVVISKGDPFKIVAARLSSPLILGIGQDEFLIASDPNAVIAKTRQIILLDDNEIAVVKPDNFFILKEKKPQIIDWDIQETEKGKFPHFMLKEIFEEPEAIENAFKGRLIFEQGRVKLGGLDLVEERLRQTKRVILVGCGTAFFAAKVGEYLIEEMAGLPAKAEIASEFRSKRQILGKDTTVIFVSQSGETADTLSALREVKEKGVLTLGVTNVVGSSQARETEAGVYTRSGPEIAVASTKAFLGQLTVLTMLAVFLARQREMTLEEGKEIISHLRKLPDLAREILEKTDLIEEIAKEYSPKKRKINGYFFLGRKYNFPIALEGALKLKEISYLPAEGLAGGELKHGSLALVDKTFPTIAICPSDSLYEKMLANLEEVKARKGPLIAIANYGNEEIKKIAERVVYLPKTLEILTPFLSVIPLHLFAYFLAKEMGRDIDKPRNLAKSVTVE